MTQHNSAKRVFSVLVSTVTAMTMTSCTETDRTEENGSSRYRMTSAFTGSDLVLAAMRTEDGSFPVGFLPWIHPYVDPYSNDVLDREWVITSVGDNFYRITNRGLGDSLSLDVINDGVFDKLTLSPSETVSGQRWRIETQGNGYCTFSTEFLGPDMALDITSDTSEPLLTLRPVADVNGQQWLLSQLGMGGSLDSTCTGTNSTF